ncbi:MAG: PrsW family glutamic-type intramembrane protease [Bacteroidota bacterium]
MNILFTLLAIAIGGGIWLSILRHYDRVEPESIRHLLQVGLVGGLASVVVAALLNETARWQLGLTMDLFTEVPERLGALAIFCLLVGVFEETSKAVATVYTTRRMGDLDEPVDAMIYAMTVGLGFAVFENVLYARQFGTDVLLARFLWPVPAHMAYSALWGYGLAKARFVFPERNRAVVMAGSVALAALIHAGANFLLFLRIPLAAWGSLLVLAFLAVLAHRRMRQLVAESPYLEPGECPDCRYFNPPNAPECTECGYPLGDTEMFGTCPCGLKRIPQNAERCPFCAVELNEVAGRGEAEGRGELSGRGGAL